MKHCQLCMSVQLIAECSCYVQSNLPITATLYWGQRKAGRCREVAVTGKCNNIMTPLNLGDATFLSSKMLIVACEYVTQPKYINKTETKQKQTPTIDARYC